MPVVTISETTPQVTVKRGDVIRIIPEAGPERVMFVHHVEHHVITLTDIARAETVSPGTLASLVVSWRRARELLTEAGIPVNEAQQVLDDLAGDARRCWVTQHPVAGDVTLRFAGLLPRTQGGGVTYRVTWAEAKSSNVLTSP